MAEALNGTFKAELINRCGTWKTRTETEAAIYEWIAWYNHTRLHTPHARACPVVLVPVEEAVSTARVPVGFRARRSIPRCDMPLISPRGVVRRAM
jgi:hypothetical protein